MTVTLCIHVAQIGAAGVFLYGAAKGINPIYAKPGSIEDRVSQLRGKIEFLLQKARKMIGERAWVVLTLPAFPLVYAGTWVSAKLLIPLFSFLLERRNPVERIIEINHVNDGAQIKKLAQSLGAVGKDSDGCVAKDFLDKCSPPIKDHVHYFAVQTVHRCFGENQQPIPVRLFQMTNHNPDRPIAFSPEEQRSALYGFLGSERPRDRQLWERALRTYKEFEFNISYDLKWCSYKWS